MVLAWKGWTQLRNAQCIYNLSHWERLVSQCFSTNDVIIKRDYKKSVKLSVFVSSTNEVTSKARRLGRGRKERERRACHIQWIHHKPNNGKLILAVALSNTSSWKRGLCKLLVFCCTKESMVSLHSSANNILHKCVMKLGVCSKTRGGGDEHIVTWSFEIIYMVGV